MRKITIALCLIATVLTVLYIYDTKNNFQAFLEKSNIKPFNQLTNNQTINLEEYTAQELNYLFEKLLLQYLQKKQYKALSIIVTECLSGIWTYNNEDYNHPMFNNADKKRIDFLKKRVPITKELARIGYPMYLYYQNDNCKNYSAKNYYKNISEFENVFSQVINQRNSLGLGTHWIIRDGFYVFIYYQTGYQLDKFRKDKTYVSLLKIPIIHWKKHHIYISLKANGIEF